jgi:transporter family-2 protein
MQGFLLILLAFFMGLMLAVYLPVNSMAAHHLGSPMTANILFFFAAFLSSIFILFVFGDYQTLWNLKTMPFYMFLPGFVGALMVLGTTFLIPKIGARKLFIMLISGQIMMGIIMSHFGALASPKDPVTLKKMIGVVIMLIGSVLATF